MRGEVKTAPKIYQPTVVIIRCGRCQACFNIPRKEEGGCGTSPPCKDISCCVFSQEFGLARFKSNQVKAMKGLEYALSNLQGTYTERKEREKRKEKKGKTERFYLELEMRELIREEMISRLPSIRLNVLFYILVV